MIGQGEDPFEEEFRLLRVVPECKHITQINGLLNRSIVKVHRERPLDQHV